MRMSPIARRRAGLAWNVRQRFPGLMKGRRIKSEEHLLSMLTTTQRRDRLKHLVALHFRWRLRGQYIPPLLGKPR